MDPIAPALAEEENHFETDPWIQHVLSLDRTEAYAWLSEQFRMIAEEADPGVYDDEETDDETSFPFLIETARDERMAGEDGQTECCICRGEVELGDVVTELACGHWFDTECILTWLKECRNCPMCRQAVD